jgi:hypothetical protein
VLLDCEHFQLCHTGGMKSSCNVHGSNIFSQSHNPTENPVSFFIANKTIPGSRNQRTDNVLTNGLMSLEHSLDSALHTLSHQIPSIRCKTIPLAALNWPRNGVILSPVAYVGEMWDSTVLGNKACKCIVVKIIWLPHKNLGRLQSFYCIR